MTHSEKKNDAIIQEAYSLGVEAHKAGKPDINPFGVSDLLKMCAWSAGYFDSKRGMIL